MEIQPASQEEINEWYVVQQRLAVDSVREMELRKKIFGTFFTEPKEGVNTFPMTDGYVMKGTYKINRKILVADLDLWLPDFQQAKLPIDALIERKPSLNASAYKKLEKEAQELFDNVLEIKPGAPTLEIVKPKKV